MWPDHFWIRAHPVLVLKMTRRTSWNSFVNHLFSTRWGGTYTQAQLAWTLPGRADTYERLLLPKSSLSQTESDFGNGDVNLFHGQPSIVAGHKIKYNQSFSSALEHMHKKPCFQGLLRHLLLASNGSDSYSSSNWSSPMLRGNCSNLSSGMCLLVLQCPWMLNGLQFQSHKHAAQPSNQRFVACWESWGCHLLFDRFNSCNSCSWPGMLAKLYKWNGSMFKRFVSKDGMIQSVKPRQFGQSFLAKTRVGCRTDSHLHSLTWLLKQPNSCLKLLIHIASCCFILNLLQRSACLAELPRAQSSPVGRSNLKLHRELLCVIVGRM